MRQDLSMEFSSRQRDQNFSTLIGSSKIQLLKRMGRLITENGLNPNPISKKTHKMFSNLTLLKQSQDSSKKVTGSVFGPTVLFMKVIFIMITLME